MSEFLLMLGRFHPLVVHLPIGFLLLAVVFAFLGRKPKYAQLQQATGFTLFLGALSAVLACVLGFLLLRESGYAADTLFWHEWVGYFLAAFAVIAWLIHSGKLNVKIFSKEKMMTALLSVIVIGLMVSGHLGGSLTHGEEYLTEYMPFNSSHKSNYIRPQVADFDSATIFVHVVQPILEERCVSCHNPGKSKGRLLLSSKEDILKGGKSGKTIFAGDPDKSELFHRVTLPQDDDKHMPPEGKKQLTDQQVKILRWWIEQKAPFEESLASLDMNEEMHGLLTNELGLSEKDKGLLAIPITPLPASIMDHLDSLDLGVKRIAKDNSYLEVNLAFSNTPFDLKTFPELLKAKDHIVWLNLGEKSLRNEDLKIVGQFPNLLRLHLENTPVSDEGIAHLTSLKSLEYLNLHGTEVTDKCLDSIRKLTRLKKIFLWKTKVTEEAAKQLEKDMPGLEVDLGTIQKSV